LLPFSQLIMLYNDGGNHEMEVPIYGSNSWNSLIEKVIKAAEEAEELETLANALPMAAEPDVAEPAGYTAVTNMTAQVTKAEGEAVSAALAAAVSEMTAIENKLNALLAKMRTAGLLAS